MLNEMMDREWTIMNTKTREQAHIYHCGKGMTPVEDGYEVLGIDDILVLSATGKVDDTDGRYYKMVDDPKDVDVFKTKDLKRDPNDIDKFILPKR